MLNNDYEEFFEKIKSFKEKQAEQKNQGLNDYNMVNVVRRENQEVGMHSNVIYSLIDPFGLHYKDDLFLNLFIKHVLKIDDFGTVYEVCKEESTKDNKRIDFTIKSDKYFIGIEMKIDASDSPAQLYDYYEDLMGKAKKNNIDEKHVKIYYLTKFGTNPASYSLEKYETNSTVPSLEKLEEYKKISFEEHILAWINACQKEVKDTVNLNEALNNYRTIVEKITGKYKSNIKQIEEFMREDEKIFKMAQKFYHDNSKWEKLSALNDLEKETYYSYEKAREQIIDNFFKDELKEYLEEHLEKEWKIESTMNHNDYKYKITITNSTKEVIFASKGYSTNHDYIEINKTEKLSKYRYRNATKSINDFYKDNGSEAKKYYFEFLNS